MNTVKDKKTKDKERINNDTKRLIAIYESDNENIKVIASTVLAVLELKADMDKKTG